MSLETNGTNGHDATAGAPLGATELPGSAVAGESQSAGSAIQSFGFRDLMRARNYEVDDAFDDETAFEQLAQQAEYAQKYQDLGDIDELRSLAEQGRQIGQYQAQIEQLRQQLSGGGQQSQGQQPAPQFQGQPVRPSAQQPPGQSAVSAEDLNIARSRCNWDEASGSFVPKHAADTYWAGVLNEHQARLRMNVERLGADPRGFIREHFQEYAAELRQQMQQEFEQKYGTQIQSWQSHNDSLTKENFFGQRLADGSRVDDDMVIRDSAGNVWSLTMKGRVFEQEFNNAPANLSLQQRLEYAYGRTEQWARQQPAPTANSTPREGSKPFLFRKVQPAATQQQSAQPGTQAPGQPGGQAVADKRQAFVDGARHRERDDRTGQFVAADRSAVARNAEEGNAPSRRKGRMPSFSEIAAEVMAERGAAPKN